jgi:hypothetical protein
MKRTTYGIFIFSIVLAIATYFITIHISGPNSPTEPFDSIVAGFAMLIAGMIATLGSFLKDIVESNMPASPKKVFDCMGSPEDATEEILKVMSKYRVMAIRNTHIKPPGVPLDISHETHEKFKKVVSDLIYVKEKTVRDVVSEPYIELYSRDRTDGRDYDLLDKLYGLFCVKTDVRFINYMIIKYSDRPTDVFFGWAYDAEQGTSAQVFRTSDPDEINFYEHHFNTLLQKASKVALPRAPLEQRGA